MQKKTIYIKESENGTFDTERDCDMMIFKVVGWILYILWAFAIMILGGWIVTYLWLWFVVPATGLAPITIPVAIGLELLMHYFQPHKEKKFETLKQAYGFLLTVVFVDLWIGGLGWIVHLFI